jgi:hypothetical protein
MHGWEDKLGRVNIVSFIGSHFEFALIVVRKNGAIGGGQLACWAFQSRYLFRGPDIQDNLTLRETMCHKKPCAQFCTVFSAIAIIFLVSEPLITLTFNCLNSVIYWYPIERKWSKVHPVRFWRKLEPCRHSVWGRFVFPLLYWTSCLHLLTR